MPSNPCATAAQPAHERAVAALFPVARPTAAAAIAAGLVQTFVFARVLTPERFSIFILIGTVGVSLWLFDLGAAKILFVRQRARHLGQRADLMVASHSSAVILLYGLIVLAGAALCFAVAARRAPAWQAAEYALFSVFPRSIWSGSRCAMSVMRSTNSSISRRWRRSGRGGHIALMLALLIGLPLPVFLIGGNLVWAAVFAASIVPRLNAGALAPRLRHFWRALAGASTGRSSCAAAPTPAPS